MASLANKTALVTGASRGIGRATASALAQAGAHVLVHYGRSAQDAESLVADIRSKGGCADAIRADLELQTEQPCWPRKFARSSVSDWMCLC
jgi:3-oxoacyl-[acyl-carrier protein] reductase